MKSSRHVVKFGSVYACIYLTLSQIATLIDNGNIGSLLYVCLSWKGLWIAPDVDSVLRLIDSDPVDAHDGRKGQVVEIDISKICGHPKVDDDMLKVANNQQHKEVIIENGVSTIGS